MHKHNRTVLSLCVSHCVRTHIHMYSRTQHAQSCTQSNTHKSCDTSSPSLPPSCLHVLSCSLLPSFSLARELSFSLVLPRSPSPSFSLFTCLSVFFVAGALLFFSLLFVPNYAVHTLCPLLFLSLSHRVLLGLLAAHAGSVL